MKIKQLKPEIMKIIVLTIFIGLFSIQNIWSQSTNPYWYNNVFFFNDQPISADEYSYIGNPKEEYLYANHTFKYNSSGKIIEHIESRGKFIKMKYKFSYDSVGRLIYYWNQDFDSNSNTYKSTREEKWVYDNYGMLTSYSNWSVNNGVKTIGSQSFKRTIVRRVDGVVTQVLKEQYSSIDSKFNTSFRKRFFYNEQNTLDSIVTDKKYLDNSVDVQYNFITEPSDYLNTDLFKIFSYDLDDGNLFDKNVSISYDDLNRVLIENKIYKHDSSLVLKKINEYHTDSLVVTTNSRSTSDTRDVTYYDELGNFLRLKKMKYSSGEWVLVNPDLYYFNEHVIVDNKISVDIKKSFYKGEVNNLTKYVYTYPVTTGFDKLKHKEINNLVYPNPTNGVIHIKNVSEVLSIRLIDSKGNRSELKVNESLFLDYPSGVYSLVVVYKNGEKEIMKIIKM